MPPALTERSTRTFYDPVEHAYYLDGRRVVSVTQALKLAGLIDTRWFTPEACARGLRVHAFCEQLDRGISKAIPDADIGSEIQAYNAFLHDHKPRWRYIERGLFHLIDAYGGRPDRSAWDLLGAPATVELKTGAEHEWHGVQTAGYQLLQPAGARFVLYLGKNGRYKLVRCRDAADYPKFRDAVLHARALLEGGGIPI